MNLLQMMDAAKAGKLKALYVVGSNPVARYNVDPFVLNNTFTVVQDMFLTETALIADVVLPVANAYEKSGTMTNTCGDLQMLKKGGDFSGVRTDFECIVRIANYHGIRRAQAGALRRRRHARRHGTVARSAVGRSRPSCRVACRRTISNRR